MRNAVTPAAYAASALLALVGALPAAAEPAVTTWTTYLRAGPGPGYAVLDETPQGARVEVGECAAGWCRVLIGRTGGYLSAEVVARGDAAKPGEGVLAQPAAAAPSETGPCFSANQSSGSRRATMTTFCAR